jgi:hypothetical protein
MFGKFVAHGKVIVSPDQFGMCTLHIVICSITTLPSLLLSVGHRLPLHPTRRVSTAAALVAPARVGSRWWRDGVTGMVGGWHPFGSDRMAAKKLDGGGSRWWRWGRLEA